MENYTLPNRDWPLLEPFWESCKAEKIAFPKCKNCGHWQWYPLYTCPECEGELEWTPVEGTGSLFSWSLVHKAFFPEFGDKVPLIVAVADVDGAPGVRLIGNIIDADVKDLKLGMKLDIVYEKVNDETTMPRFKIAK